MIATGIDAGVFPEKLLHSVVPLVGFFIGGLAQLLAGLFQAQRGGTWHATVFGGFGLFWMASFRIHLALLLTFTCVLVVVVAMTCNGFIGAVGWNRVAGSARAPGRSICWPGR